MNYAVAVLAFVLVFALGYWFIAGRKNYGGPRTHVALVDGVVVEASALVDPGPDLNQAVPK
jgi:chromate transport protein ChrA